LDPGQLAWLEVGLSALAPTPLGEPDKSSAVMAVVHYVRGAVAPVLTREQTQSPELLGLLEDIDQSPALRR
jgi:hypothetical protein